MGAFLLAVASPGYKLEKLEELLELLVAKMEMNGAQLGPGLAFLVLVLVQVRPARRVYWPLFGER